MEKESKPDKTNRIIALVIIVMVIAGGAIMLYVFLSSSGIMELPELPATSQTIERSDVRYEITGTATKVDVTLNNSTGGTEQYDDVYLPKTYTYSPFSDWFLYISAQNQGESGTVTVSIYVNGTLYKTATSSGAYVIVSASGSMP